MHELHVTTRVVVYDHLSELSEADQQLLKAAKEALDKSYAPYSGFNVGAAAILENGEIISGANQENAAYPMCLCAERVTLSAIESMFPNATVKAMAITVRNIKHAITEPAAPCGSCRQSLSEKEDRQKASIRILLQGDTGPIYEIASGKDLLPLGFSGAFL